jgi:hypothetical protein
MELPVNSRGHLWRGWKTNRKLTPHATLEACVTAMVSDSRFQGQYLVFRTLSEFATWWADPEHAMLDAFVPYYLDQGFPIFGVTVFRDQA